MFVMAASIAAGSKPRAPPGRIPTGTVVPEENVISAIRSASLSNLLTNSIAAACTPSTEFDNDPDRSRTRAISTTRRVATPAAATSRLSRPARRMKIVGTVATAVTSMMWEPSGPMVGGCRSGSLRVAPRKPGGKFTSKMRVATVCHCEGSAAVILRAASSAAASTALARVARTRYPRPRSMASPVQMRSGTRNTPTYTRAMPFSRARSAVSMVMRCTSSAFSRALRRTRPSRDCRGRRRAA